MKHLIPPDIDNDTRDIIDFVRPFTATSPERVAALCSAVRYVVRFSIDGAIVECGVWRGGSMMAVAKALQETNDTSRELYLFDTFEGMTAPTAADRDNNGIPASELLARASTSKAILASASLKEVQRNLLRTEYPSERTHFVKGPVEETLPRFAPSKIAILRLDTDWYESTRHELVTLVPRVTQNGVLIVDDYGTWQGARLAVDEYFNTVERPIMLHRIDETGRLAIVL
jgi:hypothetical protein